MKPKKLLLIIFLFITQKNIISSSQRQKYGVNFCDSVTKKSANCYKNFIEKHAYFIKKNTKFSTYIAGPSNGINPLDEHAINTSLEKKQPLTLVDIVKYPNLIELTKKNPELINYVEKDLTEEDFPISIPKENNFFIATNFFIWRSFIRK